MTATIPHFESLKPTVIDTTRVSLNLATTFPAKANIALDFGSLSAPPPKPRPESDDEPLDLEAAIKNSEHPNVEIYILDEDSNRIAELLIIEHKEANISLTLHISNPKPGKQYLAQADMIYQQNLVQTLTVPFTLQSFER